MNSLYKTDEAELFTDTKNRVPEIIEICATIASFDEMDFQAMDKFAEYVKNVIKESNENDFSSLFGLNFFSQIIEFVTRGSKPRVFVHCVDFVNCILENPLSRAFQNTFYNEEFLNFLFKTSTFIKGMEEPLLPTIIYNSSSIIYSKLLNTLLLLIRNEASILVPLQNEGLIPRLCNLYARDINLMASNKALELLKYILSQGTVQLNPEAFQPIYELTNIYFTKVYEPPKQTNLNMYDGTPIVLEDNVQCCSIRFQDFSNFCELVILLAKIDSDFLTSFNIYQLFGLLPHTNQDSALSLLDLILFIFSFKDIPNEFIDSIKWADVDAMIQSFSAVEFGYDALVIKVCQLIDALRQCRPLLKEQLQTLLFFIENGTVGIQLEALKLLSSIFLDSPTKLKEFDLPILDVLLPSLLDAFVLTDNENTFYNLLLILAKLTNYLIANESDRLMPIQDFWKDDNFQSQFDHMSSERILGLHKELSYKLNAE